MLAAEGVGFAFQSLFLCSDGGLLLLGGLFRSPLRLFFWARLAKLDGGVIVGSSAGGAETVHVVAHIVVAELAYLIAAGAWPEPPI